MSAELPPVANPHGALSHITLAVRDPSRSARIFETLLGARRLHEREGDDARSGEVFLDMGGTWLALVEGEGPAAKTYDHVAFRVAETALAACEERVRALGLAPEAARPRGPGEAPSLYFRDYDRHLIELHGGTLHERLAVLRAEGNRP